MIEQKLVTCIVPVFNGERYIQEALESIFQQTYPPLEILVVDDGSTDGTAAVVASYGERVHYLWQANAGPTAARNRGLRTARGEFITFLDADDRWHPEKLARQIARLQERPEIDLCFSQFQNFWMPELAEEQRRYQNSPLSRPLTAYSTCTLVARHTAFERFGDFPDDGTRGFDGILWFLRAAKQGAVIEMLPEVLTYRRIHHHNDSRQKGLDYFFPVLKAWRDSRRPQHDREGNHS